MTISPIKDNHYSFEQMVDIIDKKLGFHQRNCGKHYHPETGDFYAWHKSKGYSKLDPEGKEPNASQIWYTEFKQDIIDGNWKKTPYYDFWHWQLKHSINETITNYSYGWVNISPDMANGFDTWIKEIQQAWFETFKDIADENMKVKVLFSW